MIPDTRIVKRWEGLKKVEVQTKDWSRKKRKSMWYTRIPGKGSVNMMVGSGGSRFVNKKPDYWQLPQALRQVYVLLAYSWYC